MTNNDRYFDESIFTDTAFTLIPFDFISVTNRADAWLVEKLGKQVIKSFCTNSLTGDGSIPTEKIANLNPHIPCIGTNLYSLNNTDLESLIVVPFYQISVINDNGRQSVEISDNYIDSEIFTVNPNLTNFEQAIMIKYYSKKSSIMIDYKLYEVVKKHIKNRPQKIFRHQDSYNEKKLITMRYRMSVLNFDYTSPAINL